jgi:hypothetical protein
MNHKKKSKKKIVLKMRGSIAAIVSLLLVLLLMLFVGADAASRTCVCRCCTSHDQCGEAASFRNTTYEVNTCGECSRTECISRFDTCVAYVSASCAEISGETFTKVVIYFILAIQFVLMVLAITVRLQVPRAAPFIKTVFEVRLSLPFLLV